jgi:hypothetical protein
MIEVPIDPRASLLIDARERFDELQRAVQLPFTVPLNAAVPHLALAAIRAFLYSAMGPGDKQLALAIIALDQLIETLAACDQSMVYERHGGRE